jgi:hypothetical protein
MGGPAPEGKRSQARRPIPIPGGLRFTKGLGKTSIAFPSESPQK